VRTTPVRTIDVGNSVKYSANIVPYTQVDLAFKSNGYVDKILQVRSADGHMRSVDEGDWVTKGTVLAVVQEQNYLDKLQQAKAQLASAQANYEHAKLNFDRTSILYSSQSATKPEYDSAKASLDSAAAAVSNGNAAISEAQVALNYCSLRAPFNGWIVNRNVDVGSLVGPATNGFSIADTRSVKAVFGVPDIAMNRVKLGARQAVTTDALPETFQGRITSISPAADAKSRVYPVEVTIQNPHNLLKSGMIASIYLNGQTLHHPVTVIPLSAVVRNPNQPDGFAVLVTEGTGDAVTARIRPVELGDAYGNLIAVTSGVQNGDQVISTGATLVNSGDPVRVIP
jgi:multidrug efflux system membrane fusion protein